MTSPKAQFILAHKPDAEALAIFANSPSLNAAMTYSLAEMAHRGVTQEQMLGARLAFDTLLDLPRVNTPPVPMPPKHLLQGPPTEEEPKTQSAV